MPFAKKKFIEIKGRRMAYVDEGEGALIVFQHGNPTSSYLWRKGMPACKGFGRLGHAIVLGATDRRLKAVVTQVPTIDGFAKFLSQCHVRS